MTWESWIECGACGKWRTIAADVLAQARSLPAIAWQPGWDNLNQWYPHMLVHHSMTAPICCSGAQIEAKGPGMRWCCADLRAGVTCRSSASDWASVVRRASRQQRHQVMDLKSWGGFITTSTPCQQLNLSPVWRGVPGRSKRVHTQVLVGQHICCGFGQDRASAAVEELAERFVSPGALPCSSQRWELRPLPVSSQLPEYVPGRDALLGAPELAAGLDAFDAASGEHVLATMALPKQALALATPFLLRCTPASPG